MKGSDRCHADDAYCTLSGQTLRVSNLSPGGLFAVSRQPPHAGETLLMDVLLPRRTLHVQAVVCWVNPAEKPLTQTVPPGFGVRFGDLAPTERRVLDEYIRRADTVLREDRSRLGANAKATLP